MQVWDVTAVWQIYKVEKKAMEILHQRVAQKLAMG